MGIAFHKSWIIFLALLVVVVPLIYRRFNLKITLFVLLTFFTGITINTILSFIPSIQKTINSGIVYETKENYCLLYAKGGRYYIHIKDCPYDVGDVISFNGEKKELDFVTIESQFDFQEYLNNKGVFYEIKINDVK